MYLRFCLPLAALALASCSGEPEEPKSQEEVLAAMEDVAKPQPGLYRTTTEMVEFNMPGLSEEQQSQMAQMQQTGSNTSEQCLTAEEADKGLEEMVRNLSQPQDGLSCDFTKFDADGSDIDAKMACSGPAGSGATIALTGTVAETKSDLKMDMTIDAGPMGEMNMQMTTKSERIGDCA